MSITNDIIDAPDAASRVYHFALARYLDFADVKEFARENEATRVIVDLRVDGSVVFTVVK